MSHLESEVQSSARPGHTNSLVDVPGLRIGQHHQVGDGWLTGTTVVLAPDGGAVAGVDVRGGGPGTRETDLLDPRNMVEKVHAIVLSGGSAFGLAAADGVMADRYAAGQGFPVGSPDPRHVVPIVPGAVIFDLGRGGDFTARPDASFGARAAAGATDAPPLLGNVGAGTGAQAGGLKGGVGSASAVLSDGSVVAALVVVNAVGSTVDPATGDLWGARLLLEGDLEVLGEGAEGRGEAGGLGRRDAQERGDGAGLGREDAQERGDGAGLGREDAQGRGDGAQALGEVSPIPRPTAYRLHTPDPAEVAAARAAAAQAAAAGDHSRTLATTIGLIATDLTLTKAQCAKVSGIGHDGLARAIDPVHTMADGDTLFTLATGDRPGPDQRLFHELLTVAARCVSRAVVRAMLAAQTVTTPAGTWRSYLDAFPSAVREQR